MSDNSYRCIKHIAHSKGDVGRATLAIEQMDLSCWFAAKVFATIRSVTPVCSADECIQFSW